MTATHLTPQAAHFPCQNSKTQNFALIESKNHCGCGIVDCEIVGSSSVVGSNARVCGRVRGKRMALKPRILETPTKRDFKGNGKAETFEQGPVQNYQVGNEEVFKLYSLVETFEQGAVQNSEPMPRRNNKLEAFDDISSQIAKDGAFLKAFDEWGTDPGTLYNEVCRLGFHPVRDVILLVAAKLGINNKGAYLRTRLRNIPTAS